MLYFVSMYVCIWILVKSFTNDLCTHQSTVDSTIFGMHVIACTIFGIHVLLLCLLLSQSTDVSLSKSTLYQWECNYQHTLTYQRSQHCHLHNMVWAISFFLYKNWYSRRSLCHCKLLSLFYCSTLTIYDILFLYII